MSTRHDSLRGILHAIDVVRVLVRRDFFARYRNTALGLLWALISPMLTLAVFYFVFGAMLRIGIKNYGSFIVVGVLAWTWTSTAISQAVESITGNPQMVAQPGFPTETLPVVTVLTSFLSFLIAFPLLIAVLLLEQVPLSPAYAALPLVALTQFSLTLSICYLLAALNVTLRDIQYVVPVVLQLGYYLTPVFYSLDNVPDEYRRILELNPMSVVIVSYRRIILEQQFPDWSQLAGVLMISTLLLGLSFSYFRRAKLTFLEEL